MLILKLIQSNKMEINTKTSITIELSDHERKKVFDQLHKTVDWDFDDKKELLELYRLLEY